MAGPYSRSKYLAEQAAMAAAADGQQVVIVNPTLPIGAGDYNFTPPTAMLAHYLSGSRVYLDCMLNLVDARDLAQGMILAAERGRSGERYLLGGENKSLRELLTMLDGLAQRSRPDMSANGSPMRSPGARRLRPPKEFTWRCAQRRSTAARPCASSATARARSRMRSTPPCAGS